MNENEKLFIALTSDEEAEKLFTSPRWTEYQDVKPLNIYVPPTEEDKRNVEEFRKYIDEKIEKEEEKGTQK